MPTAPIPILTPAGYESAFDLTTYYPIVAFALVIAGLAASILVSTHLRILKPWKPTPTKLMPYESGMDAIGSARMQFDVKFYLIAILFLVFDVELLFLYPWAVALSGSGSSEAWKAAFSTVIFYEILIFLATLFIAYVYAWKKGVFQWR